MSRAFIFLLTIIGLLTLSCRINKPLRFYSIYPNIAQVYKAKFEEQISSGIDTMAYCALVYGNCNGPSVSDSGVYVFKHNGKVTIISDVKNPFEKKRKRVDITCNSKIDEIVDIMNEYNLIDDKLKYEYEPIVMRPISYGYVELYLNGDRYSDTSTTSSVKVNPPIENPRIELFQEILKINCN